MAFISVFHVLGPEMIGPSSSHTAGACSIALLARKIADSPITEVTFTLYNSFAKTYRGHGTDLALLGGIMGFFPDDRRIPEAFSIARQRGLSYQFLTAAPDPDIHPNTVDIHGTCQNGRSFSVRGESLGGGKMRISRINHIEVDFSGEYNTPCLNKKNVNIAFLKLFRETKGELAYSIIEFDGSLPADTDLMIREHPDIQDVIFIPAQRRF